VSVEYTVGVGVALVDGVGVGLADGVGVGESVDVVVKIWCGTD
jgi:hypothetical protein